ncbi:hypothetical protein HYH03_012404 [Edaphochlamys debaryana]|uniref:mitogen-activated protein kinase n=1 Tax=Edaphochlamys debaryana TaxID=47281 RepID=A0A836BVL7_9CHLO|nr:hypothetical protein HYH03_012404 [Edaphochlamys debaryana]|eukprot:KAG2489178.1 hypothetical protein HYH03_012404 [Edaphochlamys debaryana]
MRLADRVKGWLRKLGPSDEAPEPPAAPPARAGGVQEPGGGQEGQAGVAARQPCQPPPREEPVPAPPAPPPPQPPPQPPAQAQQPPAAAASQPQAQRASQPAPQAPPNGTSTKNMLDTRDFFAEAVHAEANRYTIREVIGKGSYGVVCSAVDNFTGEKVAIKKITNVFEHVSDATRIVREIKLLRLLKHPDIVDIKHIMLPPSPKDFKDIYVVFELLETDLHQVIKANDDLTPEHHQFFLYQMLRGLKYIHSAKVFHRDLKPKNILANSDCKLKICDFGLARPAFNDMPTTVFWTDYVATRWYRAPELCGSFFAKYSPAIDIWSVGCIFAEVLLGKPLFPGRNVVHQLELITDLLGTPSAEVIAKVRNEKARRFLLNMRPKPGIPFEQHFLRADRGALRLLKRLLAFDPAERPTAEEALADPYFTGLHCVAREPVAQPISKLAFEFDRRKLTLEDVRELIYREILEYHPQMLKDYLAGTARANFHYPSALESFKRQFAHLEAGGAPLTRGQTATGGASRIYPSSSLPKEWVAEFQAEAAKYVSQPPAAHGMSNSHGGALSGEAAIAASVAYSQSQATSHGPAYGYESEPHEMAHALIGPAAAAAAQAQSQAAAQAGSQRTSAGSASLQQQRCGGAAAYTRAPAGPAPAQAGPM